MASFASSATTCGARKHAWTKKKKSERWWSPWPSYAWHTQARMAHASRLGQLWVDQSHSSHISIQSHYCSYLSPLQSPTDQFFIFSSLQSYIPTSMRGRPRSWYVMLSHLPWSVILFLLFLAVMSGKPGSCTNNPAMGLEFTKTITWLN